MRDTADRNQHWDRNGERALEATPETVLETVAEAAARWPQSTSSTEATED